MWDFHVVTLWRSVKAEAAYTSSAVTRPHIMKSLLWPTLQH